MSQKLENLLNLALETPEETRRLTDSLNVGFDAGNKSWELIVKYNGTLDRLKAFGILTEPLIAGYAILTVPENQVEAIAGLPEIEYVEKPKRYYYNEESSLRDELRTCVEPDIGASSCILPVTLREPGLSGKGVLIAVLDSGIDYSRQDFRNPDGTTRILCLWDQTLQPSSPASEDTLFSNIPAAFHDTLLRRPPEGFLLGVEFNSSQINTALSQSSPIVSLSLVPSIDASGHGTAVAGIAASGATGVAPESSLLIVKLGLPDEDGFPSTTEIMRGVTYAVRKALEFNMPLVINLSFGNSYGAHNGSSLLERFLDNASEIGRTTICVGSGNEGNSSGHAQGNVIQNPVTELTVANYERSLSIQLWKHYADVYRISLRSPGGITRKLPDTLSPEKYTLRMEDTEILIYLGEPTPYSVDQEIYFELFPVSGPYINSGIWQIIIEPIKTVAGEYHFYLPVSAARSIGTGFSNPTPDITLTIPSTAARVITVGAYDSSYDSYADFSGRGYANAGRAIGILNAGLTKPDLVAPGVNVLAPDLYGGYLPVTGTSFAAPIVSGCAALMMEWGIVNSNDPFLYGEKVKAYLRGGARPIRGENIYPNNRAGFGALCLRDSLPL